MDRMSIQPGPDQAGSRLREARRAVKDQRAKASHAPTSPPATKNRVSQAVVFSKLNQNWHKNPEVRHFSDRQPTAVHGPIATVNRI